MPFLSPSALAKAWPSAMPVSSDRVVLVDMQVARGLHGDVEQGVAREQFEHVVEKADAGRDLGLAGAVEGELDRDSVSAVCGG